MNAVVTPVKRSVRSLIALVLFSGANAATNVASSSATLNGMVDPHGLTTSVDFQYGVTTSYGHTTATLRETGNTYQNVSANITGLSAHTTYHFRIAASNTGGTRYGPNLYHTVRREAVDAW